MKIIRVLCGDMLLLDDITEDGKFIIARSYMDIPNEDGTIFIKNDNNHKAGEFVKVRITGVRDYDLLGEIV